MYDCRVKIKCSQMALQVPGWIVHDFPALVDVERAAKAALVNVERAAKAALAISKLFQNRFR